MITQLHERRRVLYEKLYKIALNQKLAISRDDIEGLVHLIQQRDSIIREIESVQSKLLVQEAETKVDPKSELGKLISRVIEQDTSNIEQMKESHAQLTKDVKRMNDGKKMKSKYNSPDAGTSHNSVFINKKV